MDIFIHCTDLEGNTYIIGGLIFDLSPFVGKQDENITARTGFKKFSKNI